MKDTQKSTQTTVLIIVLVILVIALDQITKVLAQNMLMSAGRISLLGDLWRFEYAENSGAFLSMGSGLPDWARLVFLTILPSIFLVGFSAYLFIFEKNRATLIAGGLVCGGGVSNLYDRIANNGYVVDFMNCGIGSLRTGIFNIADVAITSGVIVMLFSGAFSSKDSAEKKSASQDAQGQQQASDTSSGA